MFGPRRREIVLGLSQNPSRCHLQFITVEDETYWGMIRTHASTIFHTEWKAFHGDDDHLHQKTVRLYSFFACSSSWMLVSHWIFVGKPVVCGESLYTTFVGIQQLDTVNMTCEDQIREASKLQTQTFGSYAEVRGRSLWWPFGRCKEDAGSGVIGTQQWLFWNSRFLFLEWQINQVKQSTKAQKLLFSETLLEYARLLHPVLRPHSSMRSHGRQIR